MAPCRKLLRHGPGIGAGEVGAIDHHRFSRRLRLADLRLMSGELFLVVAPRPRDGAGDFAEGGDEAGPRVVDQGAARLLLREKGFEQDHRQLASFGNGSRSGRFCGASRGLRRSGDDRRSGRHRLLAGTEQEAAGCGEECGKPHRRNSSAGEGDSQSECRVTDLLRLFPTASRHLFCYDAGIVRLKPLCLLLCLLSAASAVEIRVAAYNIGAQFVGSAPDFSLGDPGTPDHESVKAVLGRIDADVVSLEEIASDDVSGSPDDLDALAASLGYPYLYVSPVSGGSGYSAPIDTALRVVFLSRYPFLSSGVIASPTGAREMTRFLPVVKVDVPGTTNDPVVIAAHLKSGSGSDDRFRRAVEMKRLTDYLAAQGLTNDDNFIIMGDFNLVGSNATFNAPPSGLPATYSLGADITFPLGYSTNPLAYFSTPGVTRLDLRQLDGSPVTFESGSVLDLMMVSSAIAGRQQASEIYNSVHDASNESGLPKSGDPLPADTSATASDHFAVFGDFELDSDLPNLDLVLSAGSVAEGSPDGTVMASVTLPAFRPGATTVTIGSDDPAAASGVTASFVIPANTLSGSIALRTPRNFLADGQHSVAITASAFGHDPESVVLNVEDVEAAYVFTSTGQTIDEDFSGFGGNHDPAPWVTSGGLSWHGIDSGSSSTAGLRSYGPANDGSLGFLPEGSGIVASATFVNQTATPIDSLQIAFDVEQWRAELNGTTDGLSAELLVDGQAVPLPGLIFTANTTLPSGPVAGGATTSLSATVSGLAIPAGASFQLRIKFEPGPNGGVMPDDIFLNEFHYDNASTDAGEFIEIAVGPGFTGFLSEISVLLYNGANGAVYNTLNLASAFTLGSTADGYRIFYSELPVDGIQNGPDGFAIVNTANSEVLQFLSYEGTFTATSGAASGMTSTSIGVSQSGEPVGTGSLGLTGTGGVASDFTWSKFAGAYTKGAANAGQTFETPVLPSQGIAIDNLAVTFLVPDHDQDGIADAIDPDDDNDGQSDEDEIAFGTDPFDAGEKFEAVLSAVPGQPATLSFIGAAGIVYVVESSGDLVEWDEVSSHPGNGTNIVVPLAVEEGSRFFRVSAGD